MGILPCKKITFEDLQSDWWVSVTVRKLGPNYFTHSLTQLNATEQNYQSAETLRNGRRLSDVSEISVADLF